MKKFVIARGHGADPSVLSIAIREFRNLAEAECWCSAKSEDGRYVYMVVEEVTK